MFGPSPKLEKLPLGDSGIAVCLENAAFVADLSPLSPGIAFDLESGDFSIGEASSSCGGV
jgi:hypothetical protein